MASGPGTPAAVKEDSWLVGMLEGEKKECDQPSDARAGYIIKVSLFVAAAWWGFGLFTVVSTRSKAVMASLMDATIDLLAQGVLYGTNKLAEEGGFGDEYPVGIARLEPVGVVVCALLMVMASGWVIYDSAGELVEYYPDGPHMKFTLVAQVLLALVVAVKVVVWRIAKAEYDRSGNVSLEALALDNFNDILSNAGALCFASLTGLKPATWWIDPVGGILISCYIIRSWCLTAMEQVEMLLGKQGDEEFVGSVREIAESHDDQAEVESVKAYHFGPNLIVEIDLIMDPLTPLEVSHDVGASLQDRVERLDKCERCFVNVDYEHRDLDRHDTNLPLDVKTKSQRQGSKGLRLRAVLQRRRSSSIGGGPDGCRSPASVMSGRMSRRTPPALLGEVISTEGM